MRTAKKWVAKHKSTVQKTLSSRGSVGSSASTWRASEQERERESEREREDDKGS